MADDLDSLVKGAPLSGPGALGFKSSFAAFGGPSPIAASTSAKAGDPLSHTPSSPSMIYLNLLVLEASLRAQYLALRARRRHHTFFFLLLGAWILGFGYALFLAPREDGSGVGGSVYWVVDVLEKVCFMGGVITAILIWATGIWDRGIRWPRRWFSVSNRGLRHINCKLVLLKRPWWAESLATLLWFLTYGLFSSSGAGGAASYRYVEPALLREVDRELHLSATGHPIVPPATATALDRDEEKAPALGARHHAYAHGHEEDLAPGGDYVKLLLLAKPFSPTFRENWELYRQEYWERENERRALIRRKLKQQDRALRRAAGGWLWWLPGRPLPAAADQASSQQQQQRPHTPQHYLQHPRHAAVEREHRRTRSNSTRRSSISASGPTSSRRSSFATPPSPDSDDVAVSSASTATATAASTPIGRKVSTGSSPVSDRRRKKSTTPGTGASRASTAGTRRSTTDSRSVTPEIPSPLARENSLSAAD